MPRRSARLASKPRRDYAAMAGRKPSRRPRVAKVSAPLTRAIQRVVDRNIETKFAISSLVNAQVYNTIRTKFVPAGSVGTQYVRACIPAIANSGTASNDLMGAKCKISSLKTYLHFDLGSTSNVSTDVMVKVFFLQSRNAKNYTVANVGLPGNNLLRTGNATEEDWIAGSSIDSRYYNQLPLNKLSWTGSSKTFRLSKNGGTTNGTAAGSVPVLSGGIGSLDMTYDWKVGGKVLKYDEGDGSGYPENFLPLIAIVAWYPDGTTVGQQDTAMPVFVTQSNHLYYKDA